MNKSETPFRFKKFQIYHSKCAQKVGVDGTLLGAWADLFPVDNVLDVGTGCGLIAMMLTQREPSISVTGIDIDIDSIDQAKYNFQNFPDMKNLSALHSDFVTFADKYLKQAENSKISILFDMIISNPPFFNSGINHIDSARIGARHQASLSIEEIVKYSTKILKPYGRLALILPFEFETNVINLSNKYGFSLQRLTRVKGHSDAKIKRTLLQFVYGDCETKEPDTLILEKERGIPTDEYRNLCKDFYLKF